MGGPQITTGSWVGPCDGCSPACGPSIVDPSVIEFDQTTGRSITLIEVSDKPVLVRAVRNTDAAVIVVEMVTGCGGGDEFTPFLLGSCSRRPGLDPCRTLLPLTLSGRYRLHVCAGSCTPDDLLVVQHENNTVTDLTALMLLSTVTCA